MDTLAHVVVPQIPSALTKEVVGDVGLTLIEFPEPIIVPNPQPPAYQNQLSPGARTPPETVKVERLPGQTFRLVAFTNVGAVEIGSTIIVVEKQVVVLHGPSART